MILSLLCFGVSPSTDDVYTEGISKITKEDFDWAKRLNKTIKLVAQIDNGLSLIHISEPTRRM